jgi:hypothetical protein
MFLMRRPYAQPEVRLRGMSVFRTPVNYPGRQNRDTKEALQNKDVNSYVWAIPRRGGWKGCDSQRHPGITHAVNRIKILLRLPYRDVKYERCAHTIGVTGAFF